MYNVTDNGVLKTIETWNITIPLHDNDGIPFRKFDIDSVLQDISLRFPGFTIIHCIGYWKGATQTYIDKNFQIILDTLPSDTKTSEAFFSDLRGKLRTLFKQDKIYITKESSKQEFLSFLEFFEEVGLLTFSKEDDSEYKKLAEQLVKRLDFILERLGYETTSLRRDFENKQIIWERKLCGLILKSIIDDSLPAQIKLLAADQIDALGDVLVGTEPFALIGHYEFQSYVLDKISYRPVVKTEFNESLRSSGFTYCLQSGQPVSTERFIEEFTATVFTNCVILREEGYLPEEIAASVGSDGSLVWTKRGKGDQVFHSPAIIPDDSVQHEIIRCIRAAHLLYENNELDAIALLQAKAKNGHIFKRAFIRKVIKESESS